MDNHAIHARFERWCSCSLCEQKYHGVVYCALQWACWKTYVGRPEANYALCEDDAATLDDVREAVEMLEETTRTARRVLGGAHPRLGVFEESLQNARTVLRARNPPSY